MRETRDGEFEEIKESQELLLDLFNNPQEIDNTKAIHFGSRGQLEEIKFRKKAEKSFEDRLSALEDEAEKLKGKESEYFVFPTPEEIKKYASKGPMERNMLKIMIGLKDKAVVVNLPPAVLINKSC